MTLIQKCAILAALVSPIGSANSLQEKLSLCAKNNDSLQRLVCYDKLVENTKNNSQTSSQPVVSEPTPIQSNQQKELAVTQPKQTVTQANSVVQQHTNFGMENKQSAKNLIEQIQAKVVKVKKGPYGDQIITLDNGQVWRQTDDTRLKLSEGHQVTIKRGMLGSFFIGKENVNRRMRAKRVK